MRDDRYTWIVLASFSVGMLIYFLVSIIVVMKEPACEVTVSMMQGLEETRVTISGEFGEPCDPAELAEKARAAARPKVEQDQ